MANDEKQPKDKERDSAKKNEDAAVQRGKAAIEAQRAVDPEPDEVTDKKQEKDAEKWRNEG